MALRDKVRQTFGHRWMPFFLPIAASLLYVLFAKLLIPSGFSASPTSETDDKLEGPSSPGATSSNPDDAAARGIKRRPRVGMRSPLGPGGMAPGAMAPGAMAPGATPPVVAAPPPPVAPAAPASPDGNE